MDVSTVLWTTVSKATCRLTQAVRLFRFVVVETFVAPLTPTSSLLSIARKCLVQDVSVWISCFQQTAAASYNITGHTDARAFDEYTMKLSYKRASSCSLGSPKAQAYVSPTFVATVNVCQQLQTKRHTVCNKTAVSKSSVFVRGSRNDLCKNNYCLFVGWLLRRLRNCWQQQ